MSTVCFGVALLYSVVPSFSVIFFCTCKMAEITEGQISVWSAVLPTEVRSSAKRRTCPSPPPLDFKTLKNKSRPARTTILTCDFGA